MTAPASIHPRPVGELVPDARALRDELGVVPSRNRLMREFRIGAPKADALRERLIAEHVAEFAGPATDVDESVVDPWDHADLIGPDPTPTVPDVHAVGLDTRAHPGWDADLTAAPPTPAAETSPQVAVDGHPDTPAGSTRARTVSVWPIVLLALPAFVAVWSGWVGLGRMTGFGLVDLLPGIVEPGGWATIDSAITLPIGVETYAAYALYVWLSGRVPDRARRFARGSAIASLLVGAIGQVAYHLLAAAGVTAAPWWITTAVACLPVAVLGMGAALAHLVREDA